jgi:hypothetical protein
MASLLQPGQQPSTPHHLQHYVHASGTMRAKLIAQHHANMDVPSAACTELQLQPPTHDRLLLPHDSCYTWLAVSQQHMTMVRTPSAVRLPAGGDLRQRCCT